MQGRSPRHTITLFMAEHPDGNTFGVTRDVSQTGMYVLTKYRPPVDEPIDLYFVWGDDRVECPVTVIRHDHDGVGVSFKQRNDLLDYALAQLAPQA